MHNRIRAWCPSFKQFTTFLKHGHLAKHCNYMPFCEWKEHVYLTNWALCYHVLPIFYNQLMKKKELILWKLHSIRMKILKFELNWIPIQLNSIQFNNQIKIQLKRNECKLVEKILKIWSWIWCWKRKPLKKAPFHAFLFGDGLNILWALWNLIGQNIIRLYSHPT